MLQLGQLPANNYRTKYVFRYGVLLKKMCSGKGFSAIDTSAASNDVTAW